MWVKGRWMKANKGCWEDCECMGQAAMLEVYCTLLYRSDIFWHPWNRHGRLRDSGNQCVAVLHPGVPQSGWLACQCIIFSISKRLPARFRPHIWLAMHGFRYVPSATSQTPQWHLRSVIGMFCVMLQTANTFTPGNLMVEYWTFLISLTYNFAQTT